MSQTEMPVLDETTIRRIQQCREPAERKQAQQELIKGAEEEHQDRSKQFHFVFAVQVEEDIAVEFHCCSAKVTIL